MDDRFLDAREWKQYWTKVEASQQGRLCSQDRMKFVLQSRAPVVKQVYKTESHLLQDDIVDDAPPRAQTVARSAIKR